MIAVVRPEVGVVLQSRSKNDLGNGYRERLGWHVCPSPLSVEIELIHLNLTERLRLLAEKEQKTVWRGDKHMLDGPTLIAHRI